MAKPRVITGSPQYRKGASPGAVPSFPTTVNAVLASLASKQFTGLQRELSDRGDPPISPLPSSVVNPARTRASGTPLNVPAPPKTQLTKLPDLGKELEDKDAPKERTFGGSLEGFDPFELGGSGGLSRDFSPHGPVSGYSNLRQGGKVTKRR